MRTIVGVIAVLGLAVAVAEAQPPRERGAAFRPPEPLQPGDLPPVARGAAEDFPPSSFMPATPVTRPNNRAPGVAGPAWLTGVDPNVLPASGTDPKAGTGVRTLSPAPTTLQTKDNPLPAPKATDKLKVPAARPQPTQPQPVQPTAETPYRGTSASGAPVFAGPPAYRWYGWGTVTPGANQFAPTGQYPKASAKWYEITGATPGAFPVQVMNPLRTPPGTEPPTYNNNARTPAPQSVVPIADQSPVQPQPRVPTLERPEPPRFNPPPDTKFTPSVSTVPPPASVVPPAPPTVNVPKITTPPATLPPVTVIPPPVMPAPVVPEPVAVVPPAPIPVPPKPEPVVVVPAPVLPPPVLPPIPVPPVLPSMEPAKPVTVTPSPLPLPMSVIEEPKPQEPKPLEVKPEMPKPLELKPEAPKPVEQRWQTSPEPAQPAPGTWAPVGQPLPVMPANDVPGFKSGAAPAKPIVVRAQMPNTDSDPVATLIRQVCQGRAEGVDVRWNGQKKIMVCFEVRATAEAQKLVTDISRRPELAPYQIDFCVVVK